MVGSQVCYAIVNGVAGLDRTASELAPSRMTLVRGAPRGLRPSDADALFGNLPKVSVREKAPVPSPAQRPTRDRVRALHNCVVVNANVQGKEARADRNECSKLRPRAAVEDSWQYTCKHEARGLAMNSLWDGGGEITLLRSDVSRVTRGVPDTKRPYCKMLARVSVAPIRPSIGKDRGRAFARLHSGHRRFAHVRKMMICQFNDVHVARAVTSALHRVFDVEGTPMKA